ncbi:MAG: hypothetical protein AABZ74_06935 [Cyanobacteriota bacterium]
MLGVIVEGIDCAGKSTLIKNLKFNLKKLGGYDVRELEHIDTLNQFQRYLREYAYGERVLFDRSHISEVVFGKYLRSNKPFDSEQLTILDLIVKNSYILVVAIPSIEDFKKRMLETKNIQVLNNTDYDNVVSLFDLVTSKIPHMKYSSANLEELNTLINIIISKLRGSI